MSDREVGAHGASVRRRHLCDRCDEQVSNWGGAMLTCFEHAPDAIVLYRQGTACPLCVPPGKPRGKKKP